MIPCNFKLFVPENDVSEQGKECFIVEYKGKRKNLYTHDYKEIYSVPGLYETLFHRMLKCCSPKIVCDLLHNTMSQYSESSDELVVLDIGAGNGMVGELFYQYGCKKLIGIDIIKEAKFAAERDRPGIYDAYFVEDLTNLTLETEQKLNQYRPNCLSVVASLGFDDLPVPAFIKAFNLIKKNGWVAFNIKKDFLDSQRNDGFSGLIKTLKSDGILKIEKTKEYLHRYCTNGVPVYYNAFVGRKISEIPETIY